MRRMPNGRVLVKAEHIPRRITHSRSDFRRIGPNRLHQFTTLRDDCFDG